MLNESPIDSEEIVTETSDELDKQSVRWGRLLLILSLAVLGLAIFTYGYVQVLNEPTTIFPVNEPIVIEPGTEVRTITKILEQEDVVRSGTFLYYTLVFLHEPTDVKASTYIFHEPITTLEVARRLTEGDFDTDLVRLTHYEGERVRQLAKRAASVLPDFDTAAFIAAAEPLEGTLFPDTYFVPATYTDEELLRLMSETFSEKMNERSAAIAAHPLTEEEIVILASIIEREANSPESKKLVAGVLLNRLEIDMPLQADASIEYVLDKPLSELTPADLEIDSPYNTYRNRGLPPTPIGNPGLETIDAVLNPTETNYFYYLTDPEGNFHYAESYQEHQQNIARYLR